MDAQFYQELSPEEVKPYLSPLLGGLEISVTQGSDGDCGTISVRDKMQDIHVGQNYARLSMERVTIEACNRCVPYVFDGKKRYYSPFRECDEATSLRMLEHFCTGNRPDSVTCLIGRDYDRPNAATICPKKFIVSPPDEATAVLFAVKCKVDSDMVQGRSDRKDDFLWSIGPLPQVNGLAHFYFAFRTLTTIAFQTEFQNEAYRQATFKHAAFEEWKGHMKQLDVRRQEIMEMEFVANLRGMSMDAESDPTMIYIRNKTSSKILNSFDLQVHTPKHVLDYLRKVSDNTVAGKK